jgi:hypothetical protein
MWNLVLETSDLLEFLDRWGDSRNEFVRDLSRKFLGYEAEDIESCGRALDLIYIRSSEVRGLVRVVRLLGLSGIIDYLL